MRHFQASKSRGKKSAQMGWADLGTKNALYVAKIDEIIDRFWRPFVSDLLGAHLGELVAWCVVVIWIDKRRAI